MKKWHCHAKINLYLRVLGPLPGGFHELETLFQEIDLMDVIWWAPSESQLKFRVTGPVPCPLDDNLVLKAVEAFTLATGIQVGGEMILDKYIPIGAGLGGGSSDAASVLKGLNQSFGYPLTPEALVGLMTHLGSDVAFFYTGGTQIGRGRGERLERAHVAEVPKEGILLLPAVSLSTASVYAHVKMTKPWTQGVRSKVRIGENDLLSSALACSSSLQQFYSAVEPTFRDELFFLTGSGSTFVWLTRRESTVQGELADLLNSHGVVWQPFSFVEMPSPHH